MPNLKEEGNIIMSSKSTVNVRRTIDLAQNRDC